MSKRTTIASIVFGIAVLISSQALAVNYTPSSSLPVLDQWVLSGINDGKGMIAAESYNGFASTAGTGTITFTFRKCATVDSFDIWNNINRTTNGITNYTLKLYGAQGHLLKTITVGPIATNGPGGADVDKHSDPLGGTAYVHRIDMEITASNGRIEIREVQISGSERGDADACCP